MTQRWFLSQFFQDPELKMDLPVCSAYGGDWFCPLHPADLSDGWALVLMYCNPHHLEAAAEDSRVVVCPVVFDPSPVPEKVIETYASWGAAAGMSMGTLLAKLSETVPAFGHNSF